MPLRAMVVVLVLLAAASSSRAAPASPAADGPRTTADIRRQIAGLQEALARSEAQDRQGQGLGRLAMEKARDLLPATTTGWAWFLVGFGGEFVFFLRFVVQWIASERKRRTVVPMAFWHLSLAGTALVLAYAVFRIDPVFILAYSLNVVIYVRNMTIARNNPAFEAVAEKTSQ